MFNSAESLVNLCNKTSKKIYEVMLERELNVFNKKKEDVISQMETNLEVMRKSIERGKDGVVSHSGLSGGDGKKLKEYIEKGNYLTGEVVINAICNAVSVNEVNAAMGIICATPTAGSAGVVPAALFAVKDRLNMSHADMVNFLFTAGAFGFIIANNASISGAAGGCQAEVGSASAMAAAAIVEAAGGSAEDSANACGIALKNMLGMVCDPVAGLVEVPCIKRNAAGVVNALSAAELTLAGVKTKIPCDEIIKAMYRIGNSIPYALRETALGGLAATDTGLVYKKKIFGE